MVLITCCCDAARQHVGADGHLALAIQAADARRSSAALDADHLIERHPALLVGRENDQLRQAFDAGAVFAVRAQAHIVLFAARGERGNQLAGHQRVERGGDVVDLHAQIGGALAVDFNAQFGLAEDHRRIGIADAGSVLQLGDDLRRVFVQLVQIRTLDHVLNVGLSAAAATGLQSRRCAGPKDTLSADSARATSFRSCVKSR